jgi:phosphatidate cytidylyltransferase
VVAVTDIGGYFAGRIIGGPKFWPRVSPKKTWSGTVAGWVGAGVVGWAFMAATGHGRGADRDFHRAQHGQPDGRYRGIGGQAERGRQGQLRPAAGHGGVWDRFDGMLGASLLLLVIESFTGFPSVAV